MQNFARLQQDSPSFEKNKEILRFLELNVYGKLTFFKIFHDIYQVFLPSATKVLRRRYHQILTTFSVSGGGGIYPCSPPQATVHASVFAILEALLRTVASRGGVNAGTFLPSGNRKKCCRNLVVSSWGLYFRSGARNPRNILDKLLKNHFPKRF